MTSVFSYSVLRLLTGFAVAALIVSELTVTRAMPKASTPASGNTQIGMDAR